MSGQKPCVGHLFGAPTYSHGPCIKVEGAMRTTSSLVLRMVCSALAVYRNPWMNPPYIGGDESTRRAVSPRAR